MIYKNGGMLYLSDKDNINNVIKLCSNRYFADIDFKVFFDDMKDTFIKINTTEQEIYNCFNECFDSIMKQYETEDEYEKRKFESEWFVDKFNMIITFYSNNCPLEESHSFVIRKCTEEGLSFFKVDLFYNKSNTNITKCVFLSNYNYGNYDNYIPFLERLYYDLRCLVVNKEEIKLKEIEPVLDIEPVEELPVKQSGSIKKLIKRMFRK